MIRDLVHKYFNLKTLRCLCVVMFVLFLTACEKTMILLWAERAIMPNRQIAGKPKL